MSARGAGAAMPDRTLVVSATNVLARGFFVVPTDRHSTKGDPVNALFAVTRAIARAIAFKVPERAVAVIDAGAPRPGWPDLLAQQVPQLAPLLETLGIPVVVADAGAELDVVASY